MTHGLALKFGLMMGKSQDGSTGNRRFGEEIGLGDSWDDRVHKSVTAEGAAKTQLERWPFCTCDWPMSPDSQELVMLPGAMAMAMLCMGLQVWTFSYPSLI